MAIWYLNILKEEEKQMSNMKEYHRFHGTDKYSNRDAVVLRDNQGFWVCLILNGLMVEKRDLTSHSEQYAEDCAENWVLGVFDITQ
tara:strand:+ start:1767 stop:2024 length:258 start_codon:yes stop_codon:yes gene_type:complete